MQQQNNHYLAWNFRAMNIHVKIHVKEDSEKMQSMQFLSTCYTARKKVKVTKSKNYLKHYYFQGYYICVSIKVFFFINICLLAFVSFMIYTVPCFTEKGHYTTLHYICSDKSFVGLTDPYFYILWLIKVLF